MIIGKKGIGGSDVAAVFGVSPWKTALDLYYEKTGQKTACYGEEEEGIPLEMGNILEPYIAKLYERETGNTVLEDHNFYFHPDYPYLLANIDFAILDKKGRKGTLECKFTIEHNYVNWKNGKIPHHYEMQGQHYTMIRDTEFVDFACLFSDYNFLYRHLERDRDFETDILIPELSYFWEENVCKLQKPDLSGKPDLILNSLKRHYGTDDSLPAIRLPKKLIPSAREYAQLKEEEKALNEQLKTLKTKISTVSIPIVDSLGAHSKGVVLDGSETFEFCFSSTNRRSIKSWDKFQTAYPDVYDEMVKLSSSRSLKFDRAGKTV